MSTARSHTPSTQPGLLADFWTAAAIGAMACIVGDVLHEAVGHGGACLFTGGSALALSTVHFECSRDTVLVSAGGTLANFAAGLVCWLGARFVTRSTHLRYFLWLLMTMNLLAGAGYFLFSGIGGIGDWAEVIAGRHPVWLWRVGLTVAGVVLYPLIAWFAVREMSPLLDGPGPERRRQARRLTLIPYFTAGVLSCVAGFLNPVGMILVAISAAASSFGGLSGLAWMWQMAGGGPRPDSRPRMGRVTRSLPLIGVALVLSIVFIAVLGPGLRFTTGR